MPTSEEIFGQSFARSFGQGVNLRLSKQMHDDRIAAQNRGLDLDERRVALYEQREARNADLYERQIAEAQTLAEADAAAQVRPMRQEVSGLADQAAERLAKRMERVQGPVQAIAMHAIETMPLHAADAYLDKIESTAAALTDPAARDYYFDRTLTYHESQAAERELGQFAQDMARLTDQGAFSEVDLAVAAADQTPGQGGQRPGQGQEQGQGDSPANQSVQGLQQMLQTARTRSDYQAVRGAIRQARGMAMYGANKIAEKRATLQAVEGMVSSLTSQAQQLEQLGTPLASWMAGKLYYQANLARTATSTEQLQEIGFKLNPFDQSQKMPQSGVTGEGLVSGGFGSAMGAQGGPSQLAGAQGAQPASAPAGETPAAPTGEGGFSFSDLIGEVTRRGLEPERATVETRALQRARSMGGEVPEEFASIRDEMVSAVEAAKAGDPQALEQLLERGANVYGKESEPAVAALKVLAKVAKKDDELPIYTLEDVDGLDAALEEALAELSAYARAPEIADQLRAEERRERVKRSRGVR